MVNEAVPLDGLPYWNSDCMLDPFTGCGCFSNAGGITKFCRTIPLPIELVVGFVG
jgi:hypothetical protein